MATLKSRIVETASQGKDRAQQIWTLLQSTATDRSKLTNEKILTSLHKIGLATTAELRALEARIAELEAKLKN